MPNLLTVSQKNDTWFTASLRCQKVNSQGILLPDDHVDVSASFEVKVNREGFGQHNSVNCGHFVKSQSCFKSELTSFDLVSLRVCEKKTPGAWDRGECEFSKVKVTHAGEDGGGGTEAQLAGVVAPGTEVISGSGSGSGGWEKLILGLVIGAIATVVVLGTFFW